MKKEQALHTAVCRFISSTFPDAIFNTDLSGIRLTMGQSMQIKLMRSSNAFPDLFIIEPRGKWAGLFIELKSRDARLLLKDGTMASDDRLRAQNAMLHALEERGFLARFGKGYDRTVGLITWYLTFDEKQNSDTHCPIPQYHEKE